MKSGSNSSASMSEGFNAGEPPKETDSAPRPESSEKPQNKPDDQQSMNNGMNKQQPDQQPESSGNEKPGKPSKEKPQPPDEPQTNRPPESKPSLPPEIANIGKQPINVELEPLGVHPEIGQLGQNDKETEGAGPGGEEFIPPGGAIKGVRFADDPKANHGSNMKQEPKLSSFESKQADDRAGTFEIDSQTGHNQQFPINNTKVFGEIMGGALLQSVLSDGPFNKYDKEKPKFRQTSLKEEGENPNLIRPQQHETAAPESTFKPTKTNEKDGASQSDNQPQGHRILLSHNKGIEDNGNQYWSAAMQHISTEVPVVGDEVATEAEADNEPVPLDAAVAVNHLGFQAKDGLSSDGKITAVSHSNNEILSQRPQLASSSTSRVNHFQDSGSELNNFVSNQEMRLQMMSDNERPMSSKKVPQNFQSKFEGTQDSKERIYDHYDMQHHETSRFDNRLSDLEKNGSHYKGESNELEQHHTPYRVVESAAFMEQKGENRPESGLRASDNGKLNLSPLDRENKMALESPNESPNVAAAERQKAENKMFGISDGKLVLLNSPVDTEKLVSSVKDGALKELIKHPHADTGDSGRARAEHQQVAAVQGETGDLSDNPPAQFQQHSPSSAVESSERKYGSDVASDSSGKPTAEYPTEIPKQSNAQLLSEQRNIPTEQKLKQSEEGVGSSPLLQDDTKPAFTDLDRQASPFLHSQHRLKSQETNPPRQEHENISIKQGTLQEKERTNPVGISQNRSTSSAEGLSPSYREESGFAHKTESLLKSQGSSSSLSEESDSRFVSKDNRSESIESEYANHRPHSESSSSDYKGEYSFSQQGGVRISEDRIKPSLSLPQHNEPSELIGGHGGLPAPVAQSDSKMDRPVVMTNSQHGNYDDDPVKSPPASSPKLDEQVELTDPHHENHDHESHKSPHASSLKMDEHVLLTDPHHENHDYEPFTSPPASNLKIDGQVTLTDPRHRNHYAEPPPKNLKDSDLNDADFQDMENNSSRSKAQKLDEKAQFSNELFRLENEKLREKLKNDLPSRPSDHLENNTQINGETPPERASSKDTWHARPCPPGSNRRYCITSSSTPLPQEGSNASNNVNINGITANNSGIRDNMNRSVNSTSTANDYKEELHNVEKQIKQATICADFFILPQKERRRLSKDKLEHYKKSCLPGGIISHQHKHMNSEHVGVLDTANILPLNSELLGKKLLDNPEKSELFNTATSGKHDYSALATENPFASTDVSYYFSHKGDQKEKDLLLKAFDKPDTVLEDNHSNIYGKLFNISSLSFSSSRVQ